MNTNRVRKLLLASLVAFGAGGSASAYADDNLCVPSADASLFPSIDGVTVNDIGWRRASQYVFHNGSPVAPDAVVQLTRTSQAVFISFEVRNDPTFEDNDVIVLIVRPDGTAANDRRILIYPVAQNAGNATSSPGGPPREVQYWRGSSNWNTTPAQTNPSWIYNSTTSQYTGNIRVTSSTTGVAMKSYVVEMQIPISTNPDLGVNFSTSGNFGLYFNIVRLQTVGGSESALGELYWPLTASPIGGTTPVQIGVSTNTLNASTNTSTWPQGQQTGTCPGVQVTAVATNHPTDPNGINPNSTNNLFNITITNTGTANASNVTALLRTWRYGISGQSFLTPPAVPTAPSGTIMPGASTTLVYGPWDLLNDPNRSTYLSWPYLCSFVELNSTGGGTLIANRYWYWNMHTAVASRFEHNAVIDARGFAAPPSGQMQRFDLLVNTFEHVLRSDDLQLLTRGSEPVAASRAARPVARPLFRAGATDPKEIRASLMEALFRSYPDYVETLKGRNVVSSLISCVHGYRYSGRSIEIRGTVYPIREPAGAYCYVLFHKGEVNKWENALKGQGITKHSPNRYVVDVPVNGETAALTEIVPKRPGVGGICATLNLADAGTLGGGLVIAGLALYWPRRRKKSS